MSVIYFGEDPTIPYVKELKIPKEIAAVLINRGIDLQTATALYRAPETLLEDPYVFPEIKKIAETVLIYAQDPKIELWTFNDYDVDGLTAGYILSDFLNQIAKNPVQIKYPNRNEGYGLSMDFCKKLSEYAKTSDFTPVLITTDNGITKVKEIAYLKKQGIDVIVTDHHTPKEILPDALLLDPHIDKNGPGLHLAGCAVAFKLIQVINDLLETPLNLQQYYFALAIGTIGDMMPPHPENLAMVKLGLKQFKKKLPVGFDQFAKFTGQESPTPKDIAFEIVPRLNACGRLGDIEAAAFIFFENDRDEAIAIVTEIERLNKERKGHSKRLKEEIKEHEFTTKYALFFSLEDYPNGMGAIAAGQIADQYKRPAIAYAKTKGDIYKGSIRSVPGVNLLPILEILKKEGLVLYYGGHEEAAGLSIHKDSINQLQSRFDELVEKDFDFTEDVDEKLEVDFQSDFSIITKKFLRQLSEFPLFGGLKEPMILFPEIKVLDVKPSSNNPDNIQLELEDKNKKIFKVWAWGAGPLYEALSRPTMINLIGSIEKDFMRPKSLTIRVHEIRPYKALKKCPGPKTEKVKTGKKKRVMKL